MWAMSESDAALVEAARKGDRRALEELLSRHQGRVFRFGRRMCNDDEDAADVLQETLIAAVRTLPEFRGAASISTWLYTIARSFCMKRRRTSKFAPPRVDSLEAEPGRGGSVADPERTPEEHAAGREVGAALDGAIAALEPMYREVLVLRDVEGLPASDVAEALGITVDAVKSRLHRARVSVRERVAPALGVGAEGTAPGPGCRDVVEVFSKRLEGEIDGSACAELEGHLATCPHCRGRCDSLRSTLALCKGAGDAPVPPGVERSVREALARFLDARA